MGNDLSPQAKERLLTIRTQTPPPDTVSLSNCSQKTYPKFLKKYPKIKVIHIDHNFLKTLPKTVKFQQALEVLDLSFNNLTSLALELTDLSHLQRLDLSNNSDLAAVPVLPTTVTALDISGTMVKIDGTDSTICLPPGLVELGLASMRLTSVPMSALKLSHLRKIVLSNNNMSQMTPAETAAFPNLEVLDLSGNPLTSVPSSIGSMSKMREIYLSQTRLSSLPAEMSQLSMLEIIDVHMTEMEEYNVDMSRMTKLREIIAYDGRLKRIGRQAAMSLSFLQSLEVFDFARNALEGLPRQLGYLRNIRKIDVQSNQLRKLPGELCFLNTAQLDINVNKNPFVSPFNEWIQEEGIFGTLPLLAPYCAAYPPACVMDKQLSTVQIHTPIEFRIQAADFKGERRQTGKDPFTFTITCLDGPNAGQNVECFLKDNQERGAPGTYDCYFNLDNPGTYECAITMEGTNISGSPFVITAVTNS